MVCSTNIAGLHINPPCVIFAEMGAWKIMAWLSGLCCENHSTWLTLCQSDITHSNITHFETAKEAPGIVAKKLTPPDQSSKSAESSVAKSKNSSEASKQPDCVGEQESGDPPKREKLIWKVDTSKIKSLSPPQKSTQVGTAAQKILEQR